MAIETAGKGFETALRDASDAPMGVGSAQTAERATGPQIRPGLEWVPATPELIRLMRALCGPRTYRQLRLVLLARQGIWLNTRQIMERFHVSRAQAKRDLAMVRRLQL
ncbi:MAG: hypothetical protein ACPGJF_03315 [Sinimarinibacterium flocculans]|uniref:hypothetical protein n=1 Tax=Sinimarinibacterium flocculans TaxID=985250 RepID=UPI003C61C814